MDERPPSRRQPYASRVWPPRQQETTHGPDAASGDRPPPAGDLALHPTAPAAPDAAALAADALPPSARVYGTPEAPPPPKIPPGLARALVGVAVFLVVGGLIAGLGYLVLDRVRAATAPPVNAVDRLAGVTYPVPPGWHEGKVAPVTAFTSVVTHDGDAVVMARPGDAVQPSGLRQAAQELTDIYSRLLLHGDKVTVVEDGGLTVNGRTAYIRALRAEYHDVVNRPSYLRVMVLGGGEVGAVVVGLVQPDDPRLRADIDAMMRGLR
ncbi:hypothetical protein AB0K60_05805 [Thermopolyspora sp. NPDC052614]|uniref:hypothetical protein n=1 Tax=Thermopolyspora sp. NPDC052614 TaxID=3155682 RepID=UPI003440E3DC